jgi:hypothetical protein
MLGDPSGLTDLDQKQASADFAGASLEKPFPGLRPVLPPYLPLVRQKIMDGFGR